jgi:hypothetical protein
MDKYSMVEYSLVRHKGKALDEFLSIFPSDLNDHAR